MNSGGSLFRYLIGSLLFTIVRFKYLGPIMKSWVKLQNNLNYEANAPKAISCGADFHWIDSKLDLYSQIRNGSVSNSFFSYICLNIWNRLTDYSTGIASNYFANYGTVQIRM